MFFEEKLKRFYVILVEYDLLMGERLFYDVYLSLWRVRVVEVVNKKFINWVVSIVVLR